MARVWVYGRTSGDEADTGQDVKAQVAMVAEACRRQGYEVAGSSCDDGVSGEVPPADRAGFIEASAAVLAGRADAVAIAEASRFSRQHPAVALCLWDVCADAGLRVVCLKESHFTTLGQVLHMEGEEPALLRFITFWAAWKELRTLRRRTQAAMDEIGEGRRPTKSGLPVGRPKKALTEAELRKARDFLAAGMSPAKIANTLSHERGAFTTTDAKLRRDRSISRQTILRALGLDQNTDLPKTRGRQERVVPDGNGTDLDSHLAEGSPVVAGVQDSQGAPAARNVVVAKGGEA